MSTERPSSDHAVVIRRLLEGRRDYRQYVRDLASGNRRVAFYGCGEVFRSVLDTWKRTVGIPVDFCCDSDPEKWGRSFSGIPCVSPDDLVSMAGELAVFATLGDVQAVVDALARRGITSVYPIYRYDLEASEYLATQDLSMVATRLAEARALLADGRSIEVLDAVVRRVSTCGADPGLMPSVCDSDQYFPSGIIELTEQEAFVDVGSFDGDTVLDFVARTGGRFRRLDCFEVDRANQRRLAECVRGISHGGRIRLFDMGLWDSECEIAYSTGEMQTVVGAGEEVGHVGPLDGVLGDEPVTLIKMDIEGAEPLALRGASRIIRSQKPRLAVCVYHHFSHLWEIPAIIHELVPEHRIYLRHHTNLEYETVCYAAP